MADLDQQEDNPSGLQITPGANVPGGPDYSAMTQAPVPQRQEEFQSGEQAQQINPTRWQQWAAGWDLLSRQMPIGLPVSNETGFIPRARERADMSGQGRILSAQEANERFPGRPEPYASPVSEFVAQSEYADRQRIQRIQEWKNRSGATPVTDFAQGVIAGFADPLNLALATAIGPISELSGLPAATSALGKLATTYGENLGMNLVTAGLGHVSRVQEGEKPDVGEELGEAATSAVGGTLVHYALSGFTSGMKSAWESFRKESPETQATMVKGVVASLDRNNTPDLAPVGQMLEARQSGAIQTEQGTLHTAPETNPGTMYMAARPDGSKAIINDGLGKGTQISSSADVMNNAVSNPEGGKPGQIGETKIPEGAKLFNIDQAAAQDYQGENSLLKAIEKDTGLPIQELVQGDQTIKDVIENLGEHAGTEGVPGDILQKIQDTAKEQGYAGYEFTQTDSQGQKVSNMAHLFDEAHPVTGQVFQANPDVTPQITPDQQAAQDQAQASSQASAYADPQVDQDIHKMRHGEPVNNTPEYMDPYVQAIEDQAVAQLQELAKESPLAAEALEELRRMSATDKQKANMAKMLADCVAKGIS